MMETQIFRPPPPQPATTTYQRAPSSPTTSSSLRSENSTSPGNKIAATVVSQRLNFQAKKLNETSQNAQINTTQNSNFQPPQNLPVAATAVTPTHNQSSLSMNLTVNTRNQINRGPINTGNLDLEQQEGGKLSRTNLYIKSLPAEADDEYLRMLCEPFGTIVSTKAILDPNEDNKCKGYGFVDFEKASCAELAVKELSKKHIPAQMAKQQEQDPTNLYFSNLPSAMKETDLEQMLSTFGTVISTRILRDQESKSKGVGFARMESPDVCERVINHFNGKKMNESLEDTDLLKKLKEDEGFRFPSEAMICKLADGGPKKRSQNFRKPNFGPNIHWSELPPDTTLFTATPHHQLAAAAAAGLLVHNNGAHMGLQNSGLNGVSGLNSQISAATPILNGAAALAAIQHQQMVNAQNHQNGNGGHDGQHGGQHGHQSYHYHNNRNHVNVQNSQNSHQNHNVQAQNGVYNGNTQQTNTSSSTSQASNNNELPVPQITSSISTQNQFYFNDPTSHFHPNTHTPHAAAAAAAVSAAAAVHNNTVHSSAAAHQQHHLHHTNLTNQHYMNSAAAAAASVPTHVSAFYNPYVASGPTIAAPLNFAQNPVTSQVATVGNYITGLVGGDYSNDASIHVQSVPTTSAAIYMPMAATQAALPIQYAYIPTANPGPGQYQPNGAWIPPQNPVTTVTTNDSMASNEKSDEK